MTPITSDLIPLTALLEIDLAAVAANWRQLAALHPGETAAVVKADAYGLGAAKVAPVLARAGCKSFFTAHLEEAAALRPLLPGARLYTLNGLTPHAAADFVAHDVTPVLCSLRELLLWRAEARGQGRVLPVVLHLETGLNRLALPPVDIARLRDDPALLEGVQVEAVIAHLANAELPAHPMNAAQRETFLHLAKAFPGARRSLANSSGMFLGAEYCFDLARPGAALYGLNPTPAKKNPMRDPLRLRAPILQIREIEPGQSVGYNNTFVAKRRTRVATIGVGYADGFLRALSGKGTARFDDTPVPLIGRVSMDLSTFDVTDVAANPGDMLTLLGPGHGADVLATEAATNGYEILTSLGRRYTRRYLHDLAA